MFVLGDALVVVAALAVGFVAGAVARHNAKRDAQFVLTVGVWTAAPTQAVVDEGARAAVQHAHRGGVEAQDAQKSD